METILSKLTILFEDPFWIGIYEREYKGKYEVCKITFGAEPKDYEVFEYFLRNWSRLRFSSSIKTKKIKDKRINPKRMQRIIKKQVQDTSMGTKAQQALKFQHEADKLERKNDYRAKVEAEKERKFKLKQEKRKEKHRGH